MPLFVFSLFIPSRDHPVKAVYDRTMDQRATGCTCQTVLGCTNSEAKSKKAWKKNEVRNSKNILGPSRHPDQTGGNWERSGVGGTILLTRYPDQTGGISGKLKDGSGTRTRDASQNVNLFLRSICASRLAARAIFIARVMLLVQAIQLTCLIYGLR